MAGESAIRFYDKRNNERVSHTLKAAHKDSDQPEFAWKPDSDHYKSVSISDVFDKEGVQQLTPNHAVILKSLSKERVMEALHVDGEQVYFPSVTQISNLYANDGVVQWKLRNIAKFFTDYISSETAICDDMSKDEEKTFIKELTDSSLVASSPTDAAERGTRFHNAMELHLQGKDWSGAVEPHEIDACGEIIIKIQNELRNRHSKSDAMHLERSGVNEELGIAGTLDLRIGNTIYDYKFSDKAVFGKRGDLLKSKWCFPDRAMQLANYADIAKIDNPILCNIFCNVHTGDVCFYEWPDVDRWLHAARLTNMAYYMMRFGTLPELGDNTAMIKHALEDWEHMK